MKPGKIASRQVAFGSGSRRDCKAGQLGFRATRGPAGRDLSPGELTLA